MLVTFFKKNRKFNRHNYKIEMHLKKIVRGIYSKRSPYRMKVAINNRYLGMFCLSDKAFGTILTRKGISFETRKCKVRSDLEFYALGHLGEDDHLIHNWYQFDKKYESLNYNECRRICRTDPDLIAVIEELNAEANGICAKILIIEIPDDVDWYIEDNEGIEYIVENHRTWGRHIY